VSDALLPRLTSLDRAVLEAVPCDAAVRFAVVFDGTRMLTGGAGAEEREVAEVLRGLEAVGLLTCNRGWWRRAVSGGCGGA
jgi:hypothetical protein